jgi:hypothetical protein
LMLLGAARAVACEICGAPQWETCRPIVDHGDGSCACCAAMEAAKLRGECWCGGGARSIAVMALERDPSSSRDAAAFTASFEAMRAELVTTPRERRAARAN